MAAWQSLDSAPRLTRRAAGLLGLPVAAVGGALVGQHLSARAFGVVALVIIVSGLGVVVWNLDPAWTMSGAIALSVFNSHWQEFGLPSFVAPERFLLIAAIVVVVTRAHVVRGRPAIPLGAAHGWLLAAAAIVVVSAALAGTLLTKAGLYPLLDTFGILPFAAFTIAPVVFRTAAQRRILLGTLVVLGAYLGATAVFEIVGPHALVYPRYILDPALTRHEGRARGPFIEASTNGFALYACCAAAAILAVMTRRKAVRILALAVVILCTAGMLLTLTRSVWLSALAAGLGTLLLARGARRWAPVAAVSAATVVIAVLALVPGLATSVSHRTNQADTVYQRENLLDAAFAMTEARPLFGFGWATFWQASQPYYISSSKPMALLRPEPVHNVYVSNLAEIGVVGTGVWLIAMALALGGALRSRGRPFGEPRLWRILLGTILIFWLTQALAVPMLDVFPHLLLWTLGGVAVGAALESSHERQASTIDP